MPVHWMLVCVTYPTLRRGSDRFDIATSIPFSFYDYMIAQASFLYFAAALRGPV